MSAEAGTADICTFAGCVLREHDDPHIHEGDELVGEGWRLTPTLWSGDKEGIERGWTVDVETGSYELTLEAASALASALMKTVLRYKFPGIFAAVARAYSQKLAGVELGSDDHEPVKARDRVLRPCNVPGCIETSHDWVDGVMDDECCCMTIGSGAPANERWFVAGYRDAESGVWEAFTNADMDEMSGVEGLVEIERFAVAYRTVQEHCEALNRAALAAVAREDPWAIFKARLIP